MPDFQLYLYWGGELNWRYVLHILFGIIILQLSKNALVPLEVGRFTIPTVAGAGSRMGKKNMESEPVLSYHAVAYLDLAPLLYPGTCTMCGAFPLYAYNEADIKAKVSGGH